MDGHEVRLSWLLDRFEDETPGVRSVQTVSADGSLTDIYSKSFALAEQTYQQGADVLSGNQSSDSNGGQGGGY